jgi:hypothetical protein
MSKIGSDTTWAKSRARSALDEVRTPDVKESWK